MPGEIKPYGDLEKLVSPESIQTIIDALKEMQKAIDTLGKQFSDALKKQE